MIRKGIPRTVWALGMVSLFMDVSSEMVHSLLPLFLVTVLGASATRVGFIEGIAAPAPFYAGAVFCLGALGVYGLMKRHAHAAES